ncbi:MAG: zinc ribbon domain-containing protein [Lachnospiraceae bacterium]|nr:zinc ribbon domain-containing protein [Lachnospiraceae bacterium]
MIMFCSKCGSKIEDGCAFCIQCGTKVENGNAPVVESASEARPAKKEKVKKQKDDENNKNKIVGIVAVVVLVAVVIGLVFLVKGLFGGSNQVSKYAEINYDLSPYVLYNGKIVEDYEGTSNQYAWGTSLSGDCIITSDDYCIKDGVAHELEGVISHHVAVAASGNGVAYCTEDGAVMLLNPDTGKTITIEKKGDFAGVAISPDGKTVLYTDGEIAYIYNKGKSTEIFEADDGVIMVGAVSDGANYIFIDVNVYDTNTMYCLDKDGDEIEKFKDVSYVKYTNADNTQIAFFNGYIGVGDEMIVYDATTEDEMKIDFDDSDGNIFRTLIPIAHKYSAVSAAISAHYGNAVGVKNLFASGVTAFDTDNLLECYYHFGAYLGGNGDFGFGGYDYMDLGIYRIEDEEFENVVEKIYGYALLSNGDLVYIDANEKLVLYKDGDKETIDRDVASYVDSYDGKSIYYLTNDGELYIYKNGKSKEIAEDVSCAMVVGNDMVVWNVKNDKYYNSDEAYLTDVIDQYIYDNGKVKEVYDDIWYEIGYYSNYINRTNYLPFFDEDNSLYILYGNGKTKRIMKDFE